MRDTDGIDRVTELLREAWHLDQDFGLTQLVRVVSDKSDDLGALWYVEDDTIEPRFRTFIDGRKAYKSQQQP